MVGADFALGLFGAEAEVEADEAAMGSTKLVMRVFFLVVVVVAVAVVVMLVILSKLFSFIFMPDISYKSSL